MLRRSGKPHGFDQQIVYFFAYPFLSVLMISPIALLSYCVRFGEYPYLTRFIFFACGAADRTYEWRLKGGRIAWHSRYATRSEVPMLFLGHGLQPRQVALALLLLMVFTLSGAALHGYFELRRM